jgi:hypothetical protein
LLLASPCSRSALEAFLAQPCRGGLPLIVFVMARLPIICQFYVCCSIFSVVNMHGHACFGGTSKLRSGASRLPQGC